MFKLFLLEFAGCVPAFLLGDGSGVAYGKASLPPSDVLRDGLQSIGSSTGTLGFPSVAVVVVVVG